MINLQAKLDDAKLEYAVLVSKIDLFGSESRNDVINGLIDKCLDKIDMLERQAMPCELHLLRVS